MARIIIDDLPRKEEVTEEDMAQVLGGTDSLQASEAEEAANKMREEYLQMVKLLVKAD